ncbi:MAG: hypothetical protein ACKO0Z_01775 [Betaproteobacteria bacterium]
MYNSHDHEYRYEERDGEFTLRQWHDSEETVTRGDLSAVPTWLADILATAAVGGYLKRINQPPPDAIVWFTTDQDNNLKEFLELT